MEDQELKIVILGAGIGGLALALALQQQKTKKIEVTIYERDDDFDSRPQGYSLTIQQGIHILAHLKLATEVRKMECRSTGYETLRSNGESLASFDPKKKNWNTSNVTIPRQILRKLLLDKLKEGTVRWGKQCTNFSQDLEKRQVTVEFKDGEIVKCNALVGCDGVRSIVRDALIGDKLHYLGVMAINGIAECQHPLMNDRVFQTIDGTSRLFVKPFLKGKCMWQLTFPCEEEKIKEFSNQEILFETAKEIMKDWHDPIPTMMNTTPVHTLRGGGIFDREMENTWKTGLVTILGDAAHPMSPFKGQGANSALEDSWGLAQEILKNNDIVTAFGIFEDEMRKRTTNRVLKSRRGVEFLHTKEALDKNTLYNFLRLKTPEQIQWMEDIVKKRNADKGL